MTNEEFIHEFDVLLNAHQNEFEGEIPELILDEYEKSVFLTQAQEEFVVAAYNGKNQYGFMFESDEESRRYLSELIKTTVITEQVDPEERIEKLSEYSKLFHLPDDLLFITYESVQIGSSDKCLNGKSIEVVPITQDEFHKVKDNPYRGPNMRRALRLDNSVDVVEIVCKYDIASYTVRYVKRPQPIILIDLDGNLSIHDSNEETECLLEPITHRMILQRAVSLALSSKAINQRNNKQTIKNNQQTSN